MSSSFQRVAWPGQSLLIKGIYGKGTYGRGIYGIGEGFTLIPIPTMWTLVPTVAGHFQSVSLLGAPYQEVLFGQGGFGAGGFDTPSSPGQAAATPSWTIGSAR